MNAELDITTEIPGLCSELLGTVSEDEHLVVESSLPSCKLASSTIQIFQPPLVSMRSQLKELIGKQNKIYVGLSAEKYQLDNAEICLLNDVMLNVKLYRDKLVQIKKRMVNIYQRTKDLKKKSIAVQGFKQKELQRKQYKQQREEALIGGK